MNRNNSQSNKIKTTKILKYQFNPDYNPNTQSVSQLKISTLNQSVLNKYSRPFLTKFKRCDPSFPLLKKTKKKVHHINNSHYLRYNSQSQVDFYDTQTSFLKKKIVRDIDFGRKWNNSYVDRAIQTEYNVKYQMVYPEKVTFNMSKQLARNKTHQMKKQPFENTEVGTIKYLTPYNLNKPLTKHQLQQQFHYFMKKYQLDDNRLRFAQQNQLSI